MTNRRLKLVLQGLVMALLILFAASCSDDDSPSVTSPQEACARQPTLIQQLQDGPATAACLGDVIMVRLKPDGQGHGTVEIPFHVPTPVHMQVCLDTMQDLVGSITLLDAPGQERLRAEENAACVETGLADGTYRMILTHTRPGDPEAPATLLFVHTPLPQDDASGAAAVTSDSAQPLSVSVMIKDSCPFCDLRGLDLSGVEIFCNDESIQMSLEAGGFPESIGAGTCTFIYPDNEAYSGGNNFSGALFGGANFDGSFFMQVFFRNAQFYDSDFGPASLGVGPFFGVAQQPTIFDDCDLRGASFQHTVLNVLFDAENDLRAPFFNNVNLAGADLRDADLSGADLSQFKFENGAPPVPGPSKLANVLVNSGTNIRGTNLSHADLSGWDWHLLDWSETKMQNAVLTGGNMSGVDFTASPYAGKFFVADKSADNLAGATLSNVNLAGSTFTGLDLRGAMLRGADLSGATLMGASLSGADFTRADFTGADLESVTASQSDPAIFNGATMFHAYLKNASLPGSFFRGATLNPANLGGADLTGAWMEPDADGEFGEAILSGSYMLNTRLNGAHLTNAVLDLVSWYNVDPDAPIATGAGAFLTGASFNLADLPGLDLTGTFLQGAVLTNAQLIGANLTGVHLQPGSRISDLSTANLRGAVLINADLSSANLTEAGVSPDPEAEVFIEVLKDPGRYNEPEEYQFFAVDRPATVINGGTITDLAVCPSGARGPCGPLDSPAWVPIEGPQEPSNCTVTERDADGNIIAVTCDSSRHPAGG